MASARFWMNTPLMLSRMKVIRGCLLSGSGHDFNDFELHKFAPAGRLDDFGQS